MEIFSPAALVGVAPPGTGVVTVALGAGASMPAGVAVGGLATWGTGGRCSRCQASQRNKAENEKITKRISRVVFIRRVSSRFGELIREPGRSRPGDTDDIAQRVASLATFRATNRAARSLRARSPSSSDRSDSSRRASGAARTDTHAGKRAISISFNARAHEDIHQCRGLERKAAYIRPRARTPKSKNDIEHVDSG